MAAPASQIVLGAEPFLCRIVMKGLNCVTAAADGSLCEVIPIEDEIYKRLQLLQGQLSRNLQQVAGLNPKAFRYVPRRGGACGVWLLTALLC